MKQEMYTFNIRDAIKSFELFPKVLKLLWSVEKLYFLLIITFYGIAAFLPVTSILATQALLNAIQTSGNKEFNYVLYPLVVYLGINFLTYMISNLKSYFQSIYRIELNFEVNKRLLNKAKKLSLADFENAEVYDKLRRAQTEAIERPYTLFSTLLNLMSQLIGLVSSLVILLLWKPWIIALAVVVPIISTVYMAKVGHQQYEIDYKRAPKRRQSWYMTYLMTNDIAVKEIRLYDLGSYFIGRYIDLNKGFIKQDKKIIKKRTMASFIFELFDQLVGGFILLLIARSAYIGEILLGNTVAYIRSLSNVKGNMQGLLNSVSAMYQSNLYVKQLFDFLELPILEEQDSTEKVDIDEIKDIEFRNVSFKYPNRRDYALRNISFKIKKGENISLVGENGSGKTTLIKLLVGLYDDYEGEIEINGISIKHIRQANLSSKIGVMFQDFNKYELTCRENIALANLDLINDDTKLKEAINKAYASEMVSKLPDGLGSQLGVWFGGVQLSGGQWQRIALSRAFFRDADCYVLDEPSSALDPVSENEIFERTIELTRDKISILISHRLSNLSKIPSRIMVLDGGELIEEGTHERLMKLCGHYHYLYTLQNKHEINDIGDEEHIA